MNNENLMENVISLAKRRGFVYQSSEIYGGMSGMWDYGPLGVSLKNNIKSAWWKMFVEDREDMFGLDASIIMNPKVWEATKHVANFADPMVACEKCKKRFRADQIEGEKCLECGGKLGETKQFNMMFTTHVGASEDSASIAYLRPETAQGIFANYKNINDSFHPKLPFGVGQIGKAFRNEITPRDFLFRAREFEQMEIEYFIRPDSWENHFAIWQDLMWRYIERVGIAKEKVHELEVPDKDRAFYSKRTIDFEFDYPFGKKELYGLAYRTDYDLSQHANYSSVKLDYRDEATGETFVPHVIEPSFGLDRTVLAVLLSAYREDEIGGEKRIYLNFNADVAPVKAAVFPLLKNKPELVDKAREVYKTLRKDMRVMFDDNGNIGKRYRRQDEIGTPFCVTIDFETLDTNTVTVRDRNSGEQKRVAIAELVSALS